MKTEPDSAANIESSTDKAEPAPPLRPVPAAAAEILRLSDPSSSSPAPAKSLGSTASSVESIFKPPLLFKSVLNVVPDKSKQSQAV